MSLCDKQFKLLLKSIQPSQKQMRDALDHKAIRDALCSGQFQNRVLGSYLSGSYSRKTAIVPLDDVDIIVLIDPDYWPIKGPGGYPDSEKLLESFMGALRRRYPGYRLRKQRRSVRLELENLYFDIVPAIESEDEPGYILVPDSRNDEWIDSSPKIHSQSTTSVNQMRNGNFVPLVKLLKLFNSNLPSTAQLKSFTIETIAVKIFEEEEFDTYEEGMILFFDFMLYLADWEYKYDWEHTFEMKTKFITGSLVVPDLANTGSNVASGIDKIRLIKFLEKAEKSKGLLELALNKNDSDIAWKNIKKALRYKE